jgi:hypothetical protein
MPGIQVVCTYPQSIGTLDVGIVLVNNSPDVAYLQAFQAELLNPDHSRLDPLPGVDNAQNGNPDLSDAFPFEWGCSSAIPDTGEAGTNGSSVPLLATANCGRPIVRVLFSGARTGSTEPSSRTPGMARSIGWRER